MKKGIRSGRQGRSEQVVVCFPPRTHLTCLLTPTPISSCSPSRSSLSSTNDTTRKRHPLYSLNTTRGVLVPSSCNHQRGQASPLLFKTKPNNKSKSSSSMEYYISEPTSRKVTCAGQIKVVRPKTNTSPSSFKNWQSVMEEIERLHSNTTSTGSSLITRNKKKKKKKPGALADSVALLLTTLRSLRFDLRCFGSSFGVASDDDNDEKEDHEIIPFYNYVFHVVHGSTRRKSSFYSCNIRRRY